MGELEVRGLVKRFGDNVVVDDIGFRVGQGEFFVLLGPSGGGKSTILRLICGLERPDAGQIMIDGHDVTALPPRQRNLGMVFQDYGLYPGMDTYHNIAYGLEARGGLSRDEIKRRVGTAAEMLGLTPLLGCGVVDLSGGEQQRVALARALVKDADAYLFDEPLSNLDPKLRHQARRDIVSVHRAKGKPSVYVTHEQTEAFTMGTRVAVIAHGRLQQIGEPDALVNAPANLYMARFVGTPPMNLLAGCVARRDGAYAVRAGGIEVTLPEAWTPALEGHGRAEVALGIRPEGIVPRWLFDDLEEPARAVLRAVVADLEPLVGEVNATLSLGDARLTAVFAESDEHDLAVGDTIEVGIDARHIHLFDPATERALERAGR